jgi:hypothetical protein
VWARCLAQDADHWGALDRAHKMCSLCSCTTGGQLGRAQLRVVSRLFHAIARAISRRLPTAAARVRTHVKSCGICGGQSGTGQSRFSPSTSVSPVNHSFHRLLNRHDHLRFEVLTEVNMKNGVFWDATPCGSCKNRRFGGLRASIIRVTRIYELGTTLAVTIN